MTNNMSQSAQNAKSNQSGQANANALTGTTNGAMNSKIEQSMRDYGTYTATSDANNEYPPKNQANANMNAMSQANNQSASSAPQNKQNANMAGSASSAGQATQTSGTLTAQYDANGKP